MKRPHNEFLYSIAGLQANPEKKVQASREVIPTIRAHTLKKGKDEGLIQASSGV